MPGLVPDLVPKFEYQTIDKSEDRRRKQCTLVQVFTYEQYFLWKLKNCSFRCKAEFFLHGAHSNHRRVCLQNKPGSLPLIGRRGKMKIEGGLHGRKLLDVAVSVAQQRAPQRVLQPTRYAPIAFHRAGTLHPTAEEFFQTRFSGEP